MSRLQIYLSICLSIHLFIYLSIHASKPHAASTHDPRHTDGVLHMPWNGGGHNPISECGARSNIVDQDTNLKRTAIHPLSPQT